MTQIIKSDLHGKYVVKYNGKHTMHQTSIRVHDQQPNGSYIHTLQIGSKWELFNLHETQGVFRWQVKNLYTDEGMAVAMIVHRPQASRPKRTLKEFLPGDDYFRTTKESKKSFPQLRPPGMPPMFTPAHLMRPAIAPSKTADQEKAAPTTRRSKIDNRRSGRQKS